MDDDPQPLAELRRLLTLHRAYDEMNQGDDAVAKNDVAAAVRHYTKASQLAPDIAELPFWQAVTLFVSGKEDQALPIFKDVFAREEPLGPPRPPPPRLGLLPTIRRRSRRSSPWPREDRESPERPAGESPLLRQNCNVLRLRRLSTGERRTFRCLQHQSNPNLESLYRPLWLTYGLVPLLAGLDKFFNLLTDWPKYLSPRMANLLPVSPQTFMHVVGVIEIVGRPAGAPRWTRMGPGSPPRGWSSSR